MLTSTGELRNGFRLGRANFTIQNRETALSVYFLETRAGLLDTTYLFIPFTDLTTEKKATYKGGRYLDVHPYRGEEVITLDFNYAYNPYCVYSDRYSCPIPPAENHMDLLIAAGEKLN